jgi:hypothetical protein
VTVLKLRLVVTRIKEHVSVVVKRATFRVTVRQEAVKTLEDMVVAAVVVVEEEDMVVEVVVLSATSVSPFFNNNDNNQVFSEGG